MQFHHNWVHNLNDDGIAVDGFVEEGAADDPPSIELRAGRRVRLPPHVLAVEGFPRWGDRVPTVFGSGHEELGEQRVDEDLAIAEGQYHDPLRVHARDCLQFDRLDVVAAAQVNGPAVLRGLDSVGYRGERILLGARPPCRGRPARRAGSRTRSR
jgi:hypothetical protein